MNKSLDFSKSISFFFQLKDWQNRSLFFGGILVAAIIVYLLLVLVMMIPVLGIVLYCVGLAVMAVLAFLFVFYMNGYKVLVAQAVFNNKSVEDIKVAVDWVERITLGFKLSMANLVYFIPTYFIYFLGFLVMFLPLLLTPSTRNSYGSYTYNDQAAGIFLVSMLLYYCFLCIAWVIQIVTEYFVFPLQFAVFLKDQKFSTAVSPKELRKFWKSNSKNILILGLLLFAMSIAFIIVVGVSALTVFLCVGIILLPVVYAVGFTYMLHLQAHLVGQLAKHDKEN